MIATPVGQFIVPFPRPGLRWPARAAGETGRVTPTENSGSGSGSGSDCTECARMEDRGFVSVRCMSSVMLIFFSTTFITADLKDIVLSTSTNELL